MEGRGRGSSDISRAPDNEYPMTGSIIGAGFSSRCDDKLSVCHGTSLS